MSVKPEPVSICHFTVVLSTLSKAVRSVKLPPCSKLTACGSSVMAGKASSSRIVTKVDVPPPGKKAPPVGELSVTVNVRAPSCAASCRMGTVIVFNPLSPSAQFSVPLTAV